MSFPALSCCFWVSGRLSYHLLVAVHFVFTCLCYSSMFIHQQKSVLLFCINFLDNLSFLWYSSTRCWCCPILFNYMCSSPLQLTLLCGCPNVDLSTVPQNFFLWDLTYHFYRCPFSGFYSFKECKHFVTIIIPLALHFKAWIQFLPAQWHQD